MSPTIHQVKKISGIAGQVQFNAAVQYPGEETEYVGFVGQAGESGPVVMILPSGAQVFVTDPGRHGEFGAEWVRRFFA